MTTSDTDVRNEALETIERGLITFTMGLGDGAYNEFLTQKVKDIMYQLKKVSTSFLTEAIDIPSDHLFNTIHAGIKDEKLILEYLLFSPSDVALADIRKALGVKTLLGTPLEQRKGFRVALNVSHAMRFIYSQRSGSDNGTLPPAGYITPNVLAVILKNPDREESILSYVRERGLVSDEVDSIALSEYLNDPSAIAAGAL